MRLAALKGGRLGEPRINGRFRENPRADRPQLAAALEFAREGDVLVVARLDRLARSMRQLLTTVDTLQARGIGLRSLHENIDTTSATGRLILHIFAALGQFEVELLRERTRTALAASRARGRVGGRPPALDAIKVTAAKAMLASGTMTASEVARQVGCSASTLYRHVPGGRTAIRRSRHSPLPDVAALPQARLLLKVRPPERGQSDVGDLGRSLPLDQPRSSRASNELAIADKSPSHGLMADAVVADVGYLPNSCVTKTPIER